MRKCGGCLIGSGLLGVIGSLLWNCAALAQPAPSVQTQYELYAAGLHVADVQTAVDLGQRAYQVRMSYHTTGLVSLFAPGNSNSVATGTWRGNLPVPQRFVADGSLKGDPRVTDIDFVGGMPVIRRLVPADANERQPVPAALTDGAVDTLSAMSGLMRTVARTGACDMTLRTYDGHRVMRLVSHTVGRETIGPYRGSTFSGSALRCDFTATPIAGAKRDDASDARPFLGSVWLASPFAAAPLMPVRMAFRTRWFGDAIMYMIQAEPAPGTTIAGTP